MLHLWSEWLFRETTYIILGSLVVLGFLFFLLKNKSMHMSAAWASVKSWLFGAPFILIIVGSSSPWPDIGITIIAILGAKEFFQMTGMYHKGSFVWLTYLMIVASGYSIYIKDLTLFNTLPMIFLGLLAIVPIVLNQFKNMLQYMSLSLINAILMGWSFMHLLLILKYNSKGAYILIYLVLLAEICDNIARASSRLFGKKKIFDNITNFRTLEGFVIAIVVTLALGYGMRQLLPIRTAPFWISFSVITILMSRIGDLFVSVIRKDLGIKNSQLFIIGRGGFLDRMDRLLFTAPCFYYALKYLTEYLK